MKKEESNKFRDSTLSELKYNNKILEETKRWAGFETIVSIISLIIIIFFWIYSSIEFTLPVFYHFLFILSILICLGRAIFTRRIITCYLYNSTICSDCHGIGIIVFNDKDKQGSKECPTCKGQKIIKNSKEVL